jgi:hypothetical protein
MLCFKVLEMAGFVRLAKNSSTSLAFSNEANCRREDNIRTYFRKILSRNKIFTLEKTKRK